MVNGTRDTEKSRPFRGARHAMASAAVAMISIVGALAASGTASAATTADAPTQIQLCGALSFSTEIQWGGDQAAWHPDEDLTLLITNRQQVISRTATSTGTQLSWSGPNGNASITLFGARSFSGSAQFPNEGPVGYRGTAQVLDAAEQVALCRKAATFATEIQWGGSQAAWHPDEDLTVLITNRRQIISKNNAATGTQVTWAGPNGNANLTFFGNSGFSGSAQFPNEGPVGYRGTAG